MNLDLLIKLVKLANNNPNEHEANSAARRACKLIAEGNYEFNQPRTAQTKVGVKTENHGTWNDVRRSQKTPWSSRPPNYTGYSNPSGSAYDWFRQFWEEDFRERQNESERQTASEVNKEHQKTRGVTWDEPAKKPKIRRVCTKCGADVETLRWKEEPFVCRVCHWGDY